MCQPGRAEQFKCKSKYNSKGKKKSPADFCKGKNTDKTFSFEKILTGRSH